nr:hypothetical protein [Actinomycetota bacterium]
VGGLADSGLVVRLTKSKGWIGVMAALLVGIVALNVFTLSLNAGSSKTAGLSDRLRQENQALRSEITGGLSNERLQQVAARMGLVVPEPGSIRYLTPSAGDAAAAAARLRRGDIMFGSAAALVAAPLLAAPILATETTVVDPAVAAIPPAAVAADETVPATQATVPPTTPDPLITETGGAVAP